MFRFDFHIKKMEVVNLKSNFIKQEFHVLWLDSEIHSTPTPGSRFLSSQMFVHMNTIH